MKNIESVLEGIYESKELRRTIVPLFISNPGMGKSQIIYKFAKKKKVNVVELITSQRNPFEVSGMPMPDKDTKAVDIWDFDTLIKMKNGDILFFDELLNGNPATLNACLTLLENRTTISGKKLADIMVVAAANPQGMTPLTPQIKERFVWYNVKFDKKMWSDFMFKKYKMPLKVSSKLCNLITEETFVSNNFHTPRSIDKATAMIINGVPTPYSNSIEPFLNTIIENNLKHPIKLSEEVTLGADEQISWLKMIRINNKVDLTYEEKLGEEKSISNNEILIFNDKNEVIGEIKDIDALKLMYYFTNKDLANITEGIKTRPPDQPPPVFFSQKT